jgi:multicomponent Na+:H+ antiporter subunit G
MRDTITAILLIIGALFMFLGSIGIVRMPDLFLRMSATTKATALGVALMLLAAAIHFNEMDIAARAVAILVFFLLTAPVAAHMIGRAAYFTGVPLWQGTVADELRGHYDLRTHKLEKGIPTQPPGYEPDPEGLAAGKSVER